MSFRFGFDLLILDILLLPPYLPSLHRFVLPGFIATMKALTAVCVVLSMVCIVIFAPFDLDADRRRQGFNFSESPTETCPFTHVLATNSHPCLSRLIF